MLYNKETHLTSYSVKKVLYCMKKVLYCMKDEIQTLVAESLYQMLMFGCFYIAKSALQKKTKSDCPTFIFTDKWWIWKDEPPETDTMHDQPAI